MTAFNIFFFTFLWLLQLQPRHSHPELLSGPSTPQAARGRAEVAPLKPEAGAGSGIPTGGADSPELRVASARVIEAAVTVVTVDHPWPETPLPLERLTQHV